MTKKKDNIKDYAIAAFRFYAKMGRPDPDKLKERIKEEIYNNLDREYGNSKGVSNPTETAIIKAEQKIANLEAELLDILAVHRTLERLSAQGQISAFASVEIVYFSNPNEKCDRGDIEMAITKAALELPSSERQVYRWLAMARKIFAQERNLRSNFGTEAILKYRTTA